MMLFFFIGFLIIMNWILIKDKAEENAQHRIGGYQPHKDIKTPPPTGGSGVPDKPTNQRHGSQ